jgi:pantoate--beta-alanine ligase
MRIVRSVTGMQRLALGWRAAGARVGLVPTMGCLHAGHLSLVRRARRSVGGDGKVVVSIYVNPTQFGPTEDFSRYPRDLSRDSQLCRQEGVDVVFAPSDEQMYPRQAGTGFSTFVVEQDLARGMEGVSRPTHFRGVTTVVAKLFNIVQPERSGLWRQGLSAGCHRQTHGARPELPLEDRRGADPARGGRFSPKFPQ